MHVVKAEVALAFLAILPSLGYAITETTTTQKSQLELDSNETLTQMVEIRRASKDEGGDKFKSQKLDRALTNKNKPQIGQKHVGNRPTVVAFEVEYGSIRIGHVDTHNHSLEKMYDGESTMISQGPWLYSADNVKTKFCGTPACIHDVRKVTGDNLIPDVKPYPPKTEGVLEMKTNGIHGLSKKELLESAVALRSIIQKIADHCPDEDGKVKLKAHKHLEEMHGLHAISHKLDKHEKWLIYPMCNKGKSKIMKPSEVQVTMDVPLRAIDSPRSHMFIKPAFSVPIKAADNELFEAWMESRKIQEYAATKEGWKKEEFFGFLRMCAYWIYRYGKQKQSINPLPKINMCELGHAVMRNENSSMGDITDDIRNEIYEVAIKTHPPGSDFGVLAPLILIFLTPDSRKKPDMKTFCHKMGMFNAHAGSFGAKVVEHRVIFALEARKADDAQYSLATFLHDGRMKSQEDLRQMIDDITQEWSDFNHLPVMRDRHPAKKAGKH
mmetsp:Transcript_26975/g.47729  ORF Transcript_26975/g.47729 Transcript_26975/m.47729 type:complete len:496 (-) Transcript_26975:172-1659(-)|eukprot:CAMPEP_0197526030 /NCGR_PEP_ID=MMETSP1318-20131121/15802_1 /TAXON_ID=552666 /ORGANISM="Partenskyella glossopodia, Strain RCC365" /LENGTH=495 /DNA_ID=CAMNT_0043079949 /DNA_START=30 /DNA_END=1517 /DNA_ORIENTATION=+